MSDQAIVELNQKIDALTAQVAFLPKKRGCSSAAARNGTS